MSRFSGIRPADLRRVRGQLEWSQAELARRLGVSRKAVNHWERGGVIPAGRQAELQRLLGRAAAAPALSGAELRALRTERAWSQRELARRLRVSQVVVAKWEGEQLSIPPERRLQLRRIFARHSDGRELLGELLELLAREPGLSRWRVRATLRCDQHRLRDVVSRAIADELVHERVVVIEDLPGRLRRTRGLFPGAPAAIVDEAPALTREQLRARRLELELTHETLARDVGVSRRLFSRWEDGTAPIPPARVPAILAALERPRERAAPIAPNDLRAARERLGWSRSQLAAKLGVGVGAVYGWEHGKRRVPQHRREALRAIFELPTPPPPIALSGDELRRAREAARLSQSQLAALVGLTQTTISGWECERQEIPADRRAQLLDAIANAPLPVQAPTPDELHAEIARVALSGAEIARRLGAQKGTVYRWLRGEEISRRYRVKLSELLASTPTAPRPPAALAGDEIRAARERLGWSQRDLARAVGVWQAEVSSWERDLHPVAVDRRARLLEALEQATPKPTRDPHAERLVAVRELVEREPGISGKRVFAAIVGDWTDVRAAIRELVDEQAIHERLTQPPRKKAYVGLYPGPPPAALERLTPPPVISGAELRGARERRGWTQRELARRLDVSYSRVCTWERGSSSIPSARLADIQRVLHGAS